MAKLPAPLVTGIVVGSLVRTRKLEGSFRNYSEHLGRVIAIEPSIWSGAPELAIALTLVKDDDGSPMVISAMAGQVDLILDYNCELDPDEDTTLVVNIGNQPKAHCLILARRDRAAVLHQYRLLKDLGCHRSTRHAACRHLAQSLAR